MVERREVEVPAELAVDAHQEVLVERGRHAERIVVGEQQLAFRLDEVGAEQQEIADVEGRADAIEKACRGRLIEVSDVRAEQQDEHRAAVTARGDRRPQPFLVRRPMPHDRDVTQPVQPLLALLERLRRNVDQVHVRAGAPPFERLGEQHDLFAAAAAQLDDRALGVAERRDDRPGVPREQLRFGPGDAVPRQPADGVEQARPERVVEILRLELLGHEREIARDIGGELGNERGVVVGMIASTFSKSHLSIQLSAFSFSIAQHSAFSMTRAQS